MADYLEAWLYCVFLGQEGHLAHCPKATHPLFALQTRLSDSQFHLILI